MTNLQRIVIIAGFAASAFACTGVFAQAAAPQRGASAAANFVDLTALPATAVAASAPATLKDPPSCPTDAGGGMGFEMPSGGVQIIEQTEKPELKIEITNISNPRPAVGESVTADVRMTNSGASPMRIPWSGDRGIVAVAPGETVKWHQGEIDLTLRSPHSTLTLATPVDRLYGVDSAPGSWKTLAPGESATVRLGVKIQTANDNARYPVTAGDWNLSAEWTQVRRALHSTECTYESGWWVDPVKNDTVPLPITIADGAGPAPTAAAQETPSVATALTLHVTLAAGSDGVNLDEEISAVLRRVQESAFSVLSRRKSAISNGSFTARFSVMKDGSLAPKSVKEAGGAVDGATRDDLLKSIRDAGPFAPLPAEFDRKSIEMQVVYTLGKSGTPMGAGATAVDIGVDAPSYAHDPIFANYLQRMVGTVKSPLVSVASKYAYAGDQFFVEIQFTINRNGSLNADSVHVVRTTADAAAAKAFENLLAGVKFDPLPANFKRDSVTVKFGFYVNTKPPAYMNVPAPAK